MSSKVKKRSLKGGVLMEPMLYTVKEVAQILKCNATRVYGLKDAGLLPFLKPAHVKRFFPDDSQPVIVTIFADSVLQTPCLHALTALLPLMNQLSPLDDSRGSLCFRYCHVLLSIVFQVYLFSGCQFFKCYG